MIRAALAPYADTIRIVASVAASILLAVLVWWAAIKPRAELAKLERQNARMAIELEARNEAAALAREEYDASIQAHAATRKKEIDDAFERGKATGDSIASGAQPVRVVWRDRCPSAPAGTGTEPDRGAAQVDPDRAEAIGRVLGIGGEADALYREAVTRLESAQKIVNTCYDKPAR